MRATQGAAAPGEMIITGPPPKPSEAGSVGRGGTVEGTSFAACGEASDPQLVPTKRAAMHAWSLPCTYSPPPPWAPRTGGAGVEGAGGAFDVNLCEASFLKRRKALRPFFLPISSGRNGGARRVGGAGGASDKNPAKPPSKKRRAPRGTPANNCGGKPPPYSAWQFPRQPGFYQTGDHRSPLRTARRVVAPHGPAVAGADGRMISAPTGRGDSRCLVRAK